MYKSLLFFACCLMALSACEHEIDFDYLTSEPKIIFDGRISNEGVFVRISEMRPMSDSTKHHAVSDAQVWIASDDGSEEQLYYDARQECFLSSTGLTGTPGQTYTMKATVNGQRYEASSTMLAPTPVDTIFFRYVDVLNQRIYFVCIKGRDPLPDDRNYYLHRLWRGDELFRWNPRSGRSSVDGVFEYDIVCNSEKDIENGIDDDGKIPLRDGDVINAEVMSIGRSEWEYFHSLLYGAATMSNPLTNIRGGAQGIFMAANITRPDTIVFNRAELVVTEE